ncbi:inorganic phosphate transporter [Candidatus Micrarchaeota archaeon]|nr:inorganic phosphate transporter [Candidatus Micrarchaeota archaeon]
MLDPFTLVIIGIVIALAFDFGNGFNDAANAISTIVATGVLTLPQAVMLSAFFNFVAAFVFTTAVATTIGSGMIQPEVVTPAMIIAGLIGAIIWVYGASFLGIPVSASHALIGGYIGAAISGAGFSSIISDGILLILAFIFIAPVLGMISAFLFSALVYRIVRHSSPHSVNEHFKKLQLVSASIYSLGHGTNDAQKTMGIISILLFSGGWLGETFYVPFWVIILSHTTIALGTIAGGWKVIRTLGMRITRLRPFHGFCAETSGAGVIIGSTLLGIPVSTTHVISGAIAGVGVTRRVSAVRWKLALKIVMAWILTLPVTAIVGGIAYFGVKALVG